MPGSKRYELDVALSRGFSPEYTYLIEKNPATLANLTRLAGVLPPKQNRYRVLVSEAVRRMEETGIRLDCLHLDFCSHCESKEVLPEIRAVFRSDILAPNALVAITWLAAREPKSHDVFRAGLAFEILSQEPSRLTQPFHTMTARDRGRHVRIYEAVGADVAILQTGRYTNSQTHQQIFFGVFQATKRVYAAKAS